MNLSNNRLCGVWDERGTQKGNYDAEGITAIADALRVNSGLTSIDLSRNQLGDEGWGAIFAAICGNKDSKIMSMDASSEDIGPAGVKLIAEALRTSVTGALTVTNLLGNKLDAESAKMLAEVAKQKGISLCGIQRDQTTADFSRISLSFICCNLTTADFRSRQGLNPPDAILLASDLSQAGVTGVLRSLNLSSNNFCSVNERGYMEVSDVQGKGGSVAYAFRQQGTYTAEFITAIADALRVHGGLTSVNLSNNNLGEEGTKAICEALEQNKTLKELNLSGSDNNGRAAGAKHVAKMLGVNVGLTSLSLAKNELDDDGAEAISIGLKENKSLTNLDLSGKGYGDGLIGPRGAAALASAIAVNGAWTFVELRGNKLGDEGWGAMFAAICGNKDSKIMSMDASSENIGHAGVKLIAEALRTSVAGALTKCDLRCNNMGGKGEASIRNALQGRAGFELHL